MSVVGRGTHAKGKAMRPKVSILCITYNHRAYIKQALDGFMSQETNFPFEVIIHDDKSTDGTDKIIKEYAQKFPDIIRPIFEKQNQYSQGDYSFITNMFARAKGEYIAFCEGDDYWTDPTKLQRQVDFLEKRPDYTLVFHPVRVFFENGEQEESVFPSEKTGFTVKRLLRGNYIQTNSVMYRARGDYSDMVSDPLPGDWYAHLYHAQDGKIGFIDRVMSAYRRHDGGVWWGDGSGRAVFLKKVIDGHLRLARETKKMFSGDKNLRAEAAAFIRRLVDETIILNRDDGDFVTKLVGKAPEVSGEIIVSDYDQIEKLKKEIQALEAANQRLNDGVEIFKAELVDIKSSKAWQYASRLRSAKSKVKRTLRG